MILLGIDLETTGIEEDSEIAEIGLMLTEDGRPTTCFSVLLEIERGMSQMAGDINGLTTEMCDSYGKDLLETLRYFAYLSRSADYYVVHNGINFDIPLLQKFCSRHYLDMGDVPVIDTAIDILYAPKIKTRALTCLAAEHGLLNPYPHRALFDVAIMMKMLAMYDINTIIKRANTPLIVVQADVDYHTRQLAKNAGYHWNGEIKCWLKQMREYGFDAEQDKVDFKMIKSPQHAKLFETF